MCLFFSVCFKFFSAAVSLLTHKTKISQLLQPNIATLGINRNHYSSSFLYILLKIFIYLHGCIGSQLQHEGTPLHHTGSFIVVHGLSSSVPAQLVQGMWNLSSQTRGRTHVPCKANFNHWPTREALKPLFFLMLHVDIPC